MSFITDRYYQMLEKHDIYEIINSREALAYFMEHHVICVWVYQTILQGLYRDLIEGMHSINSAEKKESLRLITEVVLEEVVEDLGEGQFQSHLELYIEAMEDIGADVSPILSFFDMIEKGFSYRQALELSGFNKQVITYGRQQLEYLKEPAYKKAAALFYEGEPYIPDRFLVNLESLLPKVPVNTLLDYFESHIEGLKKPGFSASGRLVEILCYQNPTCNLEAEKVAEQVMKARIDLWNSVVKQLRSKPQRPTNLRLLQGGCQLSL